MIYDSMVEKAGRKGFSELEQEIVTTAIDRVFARFVKQLVEGVPGLECHSIDLLWLSAILVSIARGEGNSCIDLNEWASRAFTLDANKVCAPDLDIWKRALLGSSVCITADSAAAESPPACLFVLDGDKLYLARYFFAELGLAAMILRRAAGEVSEAPAVSRERFRALFSAATSSSTVDWQALAAVAALRSPITFITGGPGTGKTTVAARLLALLLDGDSSLRIAVAAPTGRAAARLSEAIGLVAQRENLRKRDGTPIEVSGTTLHRLLGYHTRTQRFRFNENHNLIEDVVIVDEASMIDVLMMKALMEALKPSAKLIVLGDPDQLASVDTGFVLADVSAASESIVASGTGGVIGHSQSLMRSYIEMTGAKPALHGLLENELPLRDVVVRLRTSWRFGEASGIGQVASAVRERRNDDALSVLLGDEFKDAVLRTEPVTADSILASVASELDALLKSSTPSGALDALSRFRVLVGLREGLHGVTGVNAAIEEWLRRRGYIPQEWYDYRPILITANDISTQLFNGDIGIVLAVDGVPLVHFLRADGSVYSQRPSQLPPHETAWAITVHKAQGSEYDNVVFVLPDSGNRVLSRELIYTAVTRARRAVTILGDSMTLAQGIDRAVMRSSGLADRLRK